jgi:dTDP-4-amino-4,6-dideoxygalactose transaminase
VWHLFVVSHPFRSALQKHLTDQGIGTLIHYPLPSHLQTAYSELGYQPASFPISEKMASEVLSLPMGPHLSEAEQEAVIAQISLFCQANRPLVSATLEA